MAGYIGAKVGTVTANAADIKGDISATDTTPELILKNTSEEDTEGGREGKITFKGEQSGGEETTLAQIESAHDGTSDDEKGDLVFKTNDGNDGASPTERLRLDSAGDMLLSSPDPSFTITNTTHEDTDGGRESTIVFKGEQSGGELSTLAEIEASHDGTADDEKGDLIFKTNDGSDGASPTTAMTIDSAQNVGIGDSSPFSKLHVEDTDWSSGAPYGTVLYVNGGDVNDNNWGHIVITQTSTSTGSGGKLTFASNGDNPIAGIKGSYAGATYGHLDFYTRPSGGTATQRMRITSDGTIGTGSIAANNINNTIAFTSTGNGTHADHFYSHGPHFTSDDPAYYVINHASVGVYLPYGNNSWSAHSDERIKENITPLENVLSNIENLRCVKYNLKGQSETKIGFIAQDWEANFGEVVDENSRQVIENDGTVAMDSDSESTTKAKGMSYTETIPVLLKAIQEQQEEIKTLKTKVAALEAE